MINLVYDTYHIFHISMYTLSTNPIIPVCPPNPHPPANCQVLLTPEDTRLQRCLMNITLVNMADVYENMSLSKGAKILDNEVVRKASKKKLETKVHFNQKHISEQMLKKHIKHREERQKRMFENHQGPNDIYANERQFTRKHSRKVRNGRSKEAAKRAASRKGTFSKKGAFRILGGFNYAKKSRRANKSRVMLKSDKQQLLDLLGSDLVQMMSKENSKLSVSKRKSFEQSSRSTFSSRFNESDGVNHFDKLRATQMQNRIKVNIGRGQTAARRTSTYKGRFFKSGDKKGLKASFKQTGMRRSRGKKGYFPQLGKANRGKKRNLNRNQTAVNLFGF